MRYSVLLLFLIVSAGSLPAQPVFISPTCKAEFTFDEDNDNSMIVNFSDGSTGTITEYFWDFGDGSTVSGYNPSHTFSSTGSFLVCLRISNNDTLSPCSDSICKMVNVDGMVHYHLGGMLFAGPFPINNPQSTGDTAYAYLYRYDENGLIPYDTTIFDTLGYYWFSSVDEGYYCLKSGLMRNSARWNEFIPTYYGDKIFWNLSDSIHLTYDIYNADIRLHAGTVLEEGNGYIRGSILEDGVTDNPEQGLCDSEVILADEEGKPFLAILSDENGQFLFDKVPYGNFQVFAEYTGKYSQRIILSLDPANPSADSVKIHLYSNMPGIGNDNSIRSSLIVYPNPAEADLFLQYSLPVREILTTAIYNRFGQAIVSFTGSVPAGKITEHLDIGGLPSGIYLLVISIGENGTQIIKKVIKR